MQFCCRAASDLQATPWAWSPGPIDSGVVRAGQAQLLSRISQHFLKGTQYPFVSPLRDRQDWQAYCSSEVHD